MACAQFEQKRNLQEEPEEAQGINQSDGTGAGIALTWVARPSGQFGLGTATGMNPLPCLSFYLREVWEKCH